MAWDKTGNIKGAPGTSVGGLPVFVLPQGADPAAQNPPLPTPAIILRSGTANTGTA